MTLFLSTVRDIYCRVRERGHDMSDHRTPIEFSKAISTGPRRETGAVKPGVARNADRMRARHAAITNNFKKWREYKDWAEKTRDAWDEERK
jgi:hypothetical protein